MPLGWLKKRRRPEKTEESSNFERYVSSAPCWQNAVDAVAGWNTAFPPHYGVTAGSVPTHGDSRIVWALECFGSLVDLDVLELGPLEGGHTSMLEAAGARVDAIEANKFAFLRCLITKEIVGLTRSKFWLGDFIKALETSDRCYDLIVACGVLYHLKDPLRLIDLVAKRSDALYLWTHVMTDAVMPPPDDPRRPRFDKTVERHPFHNIEVRAYRRSYLHADQNVAFCGGMNDEHRWLHRDDLMEALKAVGFQDIRVAHEDPDHPNGPALSVFARR